MCESEAIVTRTSVVPRDVDTVMDTAAIVVRCTLIKIFTVLAIPFISRLADTFVGLEGVLTDGVDAAVVQSLSTLVHILSRFAS